jgi:hypothetical protein
VEILEHYNDYYRVKLERKEEGASSIGRLFGLVESLKDAGLFSEYSVSQTTMEQIFQQFANL